MSEIEELLQKLDGLEFSPAPWEWTYRGGEGYCRVEAKDGSEVIDDGSAWGEYGPHIKVPGDNATLIAAAPDLLKALRVTTSRLSLIHALCVDGDGLPPEQLRREIVSICEGREE